MSIDINSFFNHAFHIKSGTLRGTPFIKPGTEDRVAHQINAVTAPLAFLAALMLPAVAVNALHVRPEQLHHVPEITDHAAAAAFVNEQIAGVLQP